MLPAKYEDIYRLIDTLGEYETVSSFAEAFYELIAEHASDEGLQAQWLRNRFAEYLNVETRYHRTLADLGSQDTTSFSDLRSATEKREIGLRGLLEQLGRPPLAGPAEAGRLLLAAECYYQLGLTERVVERLECALESGAAHPLVHFTLGYNRYVLAVEAFTEYSAGARQVVDESRFRAACVRAVSAFQGGLTGDEFDGQLHWWIGTVLGAAGFPEASASSLEKASEAAGGDDVFAHEPDDDDEMGLDFRGEYGYEGRVETGPITDDEIRDAGRLLQRGFRVSDLLK